MLVKTSTLIDLALDWTVAKAQGIKVAVPPHWKNALATVKAIKCYPYGPPSYSPSTIWAQGGELIDSKNISVFRLEDDYLMNDKGFYTDNYLPVYAAVNNTYFDITENRNSCGESFEKIYSVDVLLAVKGSTPLVAAMRCYVAAELGDEVEVPDELL